MESNQIRTLITLLTGESPWAIIFLRGKLLEDLRKDLEIIGQNKGEVNANELLLDEKIWKKLLSYWKSKESNPKNKAPDYKILAKFLEDLASKIKDNNRKKEYLQISAYFWEVAQGETPKALFQQAFSTSKKKHKYLELEIHRQITLDERVIDALRGIISSIVNSIFWLADQIRKNLPYILSAIIKIQLLASLVIAGILCLYLLFQVSLLLPILGLIIFFMILKGEFIIVNKAPENKKLKLGSDSLPFSLLLLFLIGSLLLYTQNELGVQLISIGNNQGLKKSIQNINSSSKQLETAQENLETGGTDLPELAIKTAQNHLNQAKTQLQEAYEELQFLSSFNQQEAIKNLSLTKEAIDRIKKSDELMPLLDEDVNKEIEIVKQIKSILDFTDDNFIDVIEQKGDTEEGQEKLVSLILSYQLRVKTNSSSKYPDIKPDGIIRGDTEKALMEEVKDKLEVKKQKPAQASPAQSTLNQMNQTDKDNAINKLLTSTKPAIQNIIEKIKQENLVSDDTSGEEKVLSAIKTVLNLSDDFDGFDLMDVLDQTAGTKRLQEQLVQKIYEYQIKAKTDYPNFNITTLDGIISDGHDTQKALLEDIKKQLNRTNN